MAGEGADLPAIDPSRKDIPMATITDQIMRSADTRHTARPTRDGWEVTWLPDRTLTRNQAVTAIMLAELVGGRGVGLHDDPIWLNVDGWAAELGLTGPRAVVLASEPPAGE
jgi:hypothetical protein